MGGDWRCVDCWSKCFCRWLFRRHDRPAAEQCPVLCRYDQGIIDDAAESAERFKFRYSRKDELQADILGFRYLQFLGYDPRSFLTMLEKIGVENDKYYDKKSSHPKTELRIEVIKTLLGKESQ